MFQENQASGCAWVFAAMLLVAVGVIVSPAATWLFNHLTIAWR